MRPQYLVWAGAGRCAAFCGIVAALWIVGCSGSQDATGIGGDFGWGGQSGTANNGGVGAKVGAVGTSGSTGIVGGSAARGGTAGAAGASGVGSAGRAGTGGIAAGGVSGTSGRATGGVPAGGTSGSAGNSATAGSSGSGVCVAVTAVANMKIGWNLGNSLDSVDASKSDTVVETAWGNPVVTAALIKTVTSAGFGVVRIPVTWIGRFGAAPNYTISSTFIGRVEEVVKYVLDQGLYAIINLHHDGSEGVTGQWISLVDSSGQVSSTHTEQVLTQFRKIWTQIADRFKNTGDHLIFESMNEIKVGYGAPIQSYYDQVNALNQAFVDTVRASGGNNPARCLVVPGYNTNIDQTVAGFVAPTDTSAGKLILSAHFYDPWSYAGEASTHAWGTGNAGIDNWGQEDWVQNVVGKLKSSYIDKGIPVIWGEYGAVNQSGYENYRRYYMEYVTKATHDAGIVPIFWDIGSTSSGNNAFGLINRSSNAVQYPTILEAMMRAVTSNYTLADVAKP